jgi:hypothetical protein
MKKILLLFILTILLQSCYNDSEEAIYGVVDCDVTNVTYSTDVAPIINSSCATTGCHVSGGSGPGNFNDFNELSAKIADGSFQNRVLVQMTMPPSVPLQDCELDLIQAWIDNGALND